MKTNNKKTKKNEDETETETVMLDPIDAQAAYDAMLDKIAAVPDSEILPIVADIPFAVHIVLGSADKMRSLLPKLSKVAFFDVTPVVEIESIAGACWHAHNVAVSPASSSIAPMLEEGTKVRADLLANADALAHFGIVSEERVAAIRAGSGFLDLADDLQQLARLHREVWDRIRDRSLVGREVVDRAAALGFDLGRALGARRLDSDVVTDDVEHDPKRMRERAYTLLVKAWDQCRRGAAFLRWEAGDADRYAPSLFMKRRRRSSASELDVEAPTPVSELATPPAVDEQPAPAPVEVPTIAPTLTTPSPA